MKRKPLLATIRPSIAGFILGQMLACNAPPPPTNVLPTATPAPMTAVPTAVRPTATVATATPTRIPPTATPSTMIVQIFLIALEDNGQSGKKIGCNDSVVPVQVETPYTRGVLRAALEELLSIRDRYYGQSGLYNALSQSNLQVERVVIEDGVATIHLSGTLMLEGTCDNPRVKAQIEETALQFPTVREVRVFVNDTPLDEILSLQ